MERFKKVMVLACMFLFSLTIVVGQSEREKEEAREFKIRFEAIREHDRIYNACLLDKGPDVDMQVNALRKAVEETCEDIAWNPSWWQSWKYD